MQLLERIQVGSLRGLGTFVSLVVLSLRIRLLGHYRLEALHVGGVQTHLGGSLLCERSSICGVCRGVEGLEIE